MPNDHQPDREKSMDNYAARIETYDDLFARNVITQETWIELSEEALHEHKAFCALCDACEKG